MQDIETKLNKIEGGCIMLGLIKEHIEQRLEQTIDTTDVLVAFEDAKSIISNRLLYGHDVTAKDFLDILTGCVERKVMNDRKESNER